MVWTCLLLTLAAGCQSYEPSPLEPQRHLELWSARTMEGASLEAFLGELEQLGRTSARGFDASDGLDLREGQLVALVHNPSLRLARLRVGRAAASAELAGLWPDPRFTFDLLRITGGVPDPWVIAPGLGLQLPTSGRLGPERDRAAALSSATMSAGLEAEWLVWRDVWSAWVRWSATRVRAEETERLTASMEELAGSTDELARRGELARTQASLFRLEIVRRRIQLQRLEGETQALEQDLRALLGLTPEAPVHFVPSLGTPELGAEARTGAEGFAGLELRNPTLARLRAAYEVSEESLRREIAEQRPDLTLGPLFESDGGQTRVGLSGGLPLPLWNANRRAIAEARADRELARAAYENGQQELVARWSAAAARADALELARISLEQELLPLVERQLEDSIALMRLGEGQPLVLLESLTRAFQTKLDLVDTRAQEALARVECAFLAGPNPSAQPFPSVEERP